LSPQRGGSSPFVRFACFLEKYRMVNVINYALAHDGVVPYYQGIYDNQEHAIHHYEAQGSPPPPEGKKVPCPVGNRAGRDEGGWDEDGVSHISITVSIPHDRPGRKQKCKIS